MIKDCDTCKHYGCEPGELPCGTCVDDSNGDPIEWEAAEVLEETDMVNRPPHYTHGRVECIDVMLDNFGKEAVKHFCLLNAFKYIWRTNYKNGVEDIRKAWWYLDKYLDLEGMIDE